MTKVEEAILKLDAKQKDFEAVICLFNGRDAIVDEIASSTELRQELGAKFKAYLACRDLEDAVDGFVQTEDNAQARKESVLNRFRAVAALD